MGASIRDFVDDELLLLALEQMDGVAILDADGRFVYVNRSWSDLMGGIPLEQVRGRRAEELFPETKVHEVLSSGKSAAFGEVTRLRDGGKAYGTWYPIIRRGEVLGALFHIILRDMDEARSLAADVQRLNQQLEYYKQELSRVQGAKYSLANIVGESPAIHALRRDLVNISRSSSTVLITGETGCGKELVAHTIHSLSPRQTAPFVKVNCAAIPSELMEAEFFGYEPGAFTGASRKGGVGKFEMADHGTLFLDEINHLPLTLQPKLLRVLQEREIERVGGGESIPVDVRILAASNVP
ncbi:MAG: sigma 54-interacting transcriptional regulator, partial [Oscillibacter sp.]|nr:sigma 54-interacting transcriptional regulator [Oscillibacter sp.]